MGRFILFAFLLVCLVAMYQASPLPQEAEQDPLAKFGETVKEMWDSAKENVGKQVESIMQDKRVQEAIEGTKQFFEKAGETITKEAGKIVSKD